MTTPLEYLMTALVMPGGSGRGGATLEGTPLVCRSAVRWRHPAVLQIEVDREVRAVFGLLPTARDGTGVLAKGSNEPLRKRLTIALERPLPVVDPHGVDATHPTVVAVELHVGALGSVAADDRDRVRKTRLFDDRTLDEMRSRCVSLKTGTSAPRPRLTVRARRLHRPFAQESFQRPKGLLRAPLRHRPRLLLSDNEPRSRPVATPPRRFRWSCASLGPGPTGVVDAPP